jgi:hypothetical protein
MGVGTRNRARLQKGTSITQGTGKPRTLTVVAKDGSKRVLDIEAGEFTIPTGELFSTPASPEKRFVVQRHRLGYDESGNISGTEVESKVVDANGAEVSPATLLNPHHFDTDPDDYSQSEEMSDEERAYRFRNRRPEFNQFVAGIRYRSGAEIDRYDWCYDEECEPLFIENPDSKTDQVDAQGISLSKTQEVEAQAALHGFEVEWGDYDEDSDQVKLWLHDPVVAKLIPDDYNLYTLRGPRVGGDEDDWHDGEDL